MLNTLRFVLIKRGKFVGVWLVLLWHAYWLHVAILINQILVAFRKSIAKQYMGD